MLETNVETTVCNRAKMAGYEHRKVQWQGRRGAMDHAFFGHGRLVLMEFKRPGKSIDPQSQQGREFNRLKALYPEIYEVSSIAEGLRILGIDDA